MDSLPIVSREIEKEKSFKIFPLEDYLNFMNQYPELKYGNFKLQKTIQIQCPTFDIENPTVTVNVYIISYIIPESTSFLSSTTFQTLSKLLKTVFIPNGVIVYKFDNESDKYTITHIDKRYISNLNCESVFDHILNKSISQEIDCFIGAIEKFKDVKLRSIFDINEVVNKLFQSAGVSDIYEARKHALENTIGIGVMNPAYSFLQKAFIEMFAKNENSFNIQLTEEDLNEIYFLKNIPRYTDLLKMKYDMENRSKRKKEPINAGFVTESLGVDLNDLFSLLLFNPEIAPEMNIGQFTQIPDDLQQAISTGDCKYYILRTLGADSELIKMRGQHISIILEAVIEGERRHYNFGYGFLNQLENNKTFNTIQSLSPQSFLNNPMYKKFINLFKYSYGSIYTPDFAILKKLQQAVKKDYSKLQFIEIVDYGICNQGHSQRINNLLKDTFNVVLNCRLFYEYVDGENKFYLRHDNDIDYMYTKSNSVYKEGVFNPFSQRECNLDNPGNCSSTAQYIFQDKIRCSRLKIPFAADLVPGWNAPDNCVKIDGKKPKCHKVLE